MPFNPFISVTGRNALTLFDIRLDNDFLVFRGNEQEAGGQLLKGVLAICVPAAIKVEDIHLRLTATQRLAWTDPRATPTGLAGSKVDRTYTIFQHYWPSFFGTPGKSVMLEKGNYEFPFELMLPGDTCESFEGLHEASVTYKLKATIGRGKLAYDLHTYKHLRIVRTLEASALEFLHAMSVENIWPNKVEYAIVLPRKAVVFGSHISLESRFSPLLKGLEIGDIRLRLHEIHEFVANTTAGASSTFNPIREYFHDRVVAHWSIPVSREEHWHDMIDDTGQEGWVVNTTLDLPRKLGRCVQDINVHGIKVRHKLKMVVALKNPDGHVSELRANLPLSIFISPNIPLDEQGNLTTPAGQPGTPTESGNIAPPGYGEHVLDKLYDDVEIYNLQTPAPMSTVHSPIYGMSRAGSSENLASMVSMPVPPAALTSRLQNMSLYDTPAGRRNRHSGILTPPGSSDMVTPFVGLHTSQQFVHRSTTDHTLGSEPVSRPMSRSNSRGSHHSDHSDPEHIDYPDLTELCKVPSYGTAMKNSRVGPITIGESYRQLPDYHTASSVPSLSRASSISSQSVPAIGEGTSNSAFPTVSSSLSTEPLALIAEAPHENAHQESAPASPSVQETASGAASTPSSMTPGTTASTMPNGTVMETSRPRIPSYHSDLGSFSGRRRMNSHARQPTQGNGDVDERSWLYLLQARGRVAT